MERDSMWNVLAINPEISKSLHLVAAEYLGKLVVFGGTSLYTYRMYI